MLPWLLAHPGFEVGGNGFDYPDPATFSWLAFDLHLSVVLGTALLVLLYVWGVTTARVRYGLSAEPVAKWRVVSFTAAILVLLSALNGPIHHLSDYYLFSAHMVQHLMLMQVFAPLLMLAIPPWLLRPLFRADRVARVAGQIVRPVSAFLISGTVLVFWHIPSWYELTMFDHDVHIFEHVTFMAAAVIYWWPVINLAPGRIATPPPMWQMIYLFATTLPMVVVGAFITMSEHIIYPFYAYAPRVFEGLDALTDQVLGGVIMWMPGAMMPWLAIAIVFFRWFTSEEDGVYARARQTVPLRSR